MRCWGRKKRVRKRAAWRSAQKDSPHGQRPSKKATCPPTAVIPGTKDVFGPQDVTAILDGGWVPMVYTVNDPQRAKQLYDWGMASIVTDDPPALLGL